MLVSFLSAPSRAVVVVAALAGCTDPGVDVDPWQASLAVSGDAWLLSTWGPAADDMIAVGGHDDAGMMQRFDGTRWTAEELPAGTPLLNWAHGFGASDITVVGNAGTVLHFDGAAWTRQDTPTDQNLWGVWGASPDDLWAVGGNGRASGQATVLHHDGTAWERVSLPDLERAGVNAFFKVWGTGPDNVYVVGQRGAVLHFDGAVWTEQHVGASEDLISLWGSGPDRIVAVGGRGNGIVSHFDGAAWDTFSVSPTPGLNGVWVRPGAVHVAGNNGTLGTVDLDTQTFVADENPGTQLDFHAIFGQRDTLFAVGGNLLATDPPFEGIVATRSFETNE